MTSRAHSGTIRWEHLCLECARDGLVLTDREEGRTVGRAQLSVGSQWARADLVVEADEAIWRWSCPQARAELRLTADRTVSMRLRVTAGAREAVLSGLPALDWHGPFSCPRWPGGGSALVLLDERPGDGSVLAATQTRGHAHRDGRGLVLGPDELTLATGCSWVSSWTIDRHPSLTAALGTLPAWVPARTCVGPDEPLRIELPDAAVSGPGRISTDERGSVLVAAPGVHRFTVAGPGVDCLVALAWAEPAALIAGRRARHVLDGEPRTAGDAEAMILAWADSAHELPHSQAHCFLRAWADELLDRSGPPVGPLAIGALVADAGPERSRLVRLAGLLDALSPSPGALLAWMSAAPALVRAGLTPPPAPVDRDDALCRVLAATAAGAAEAPAELRAVLPRLHSGLPWPLDRERHTDTALCCAALTLVPEHWRIRPSAPRTLPELVEETRRWLCADDPDDEALAWLLWS